MYQLLNNITQKRKGDLLYYNFDEVIDRHNTNAVNVEGYMSYLFNNQVSLKSNIEKKDLIKMWIADMDFATPDFIINSIRKRLDKQILGYSMVFDDDYFKSFTNWTRKNYNLCINEESITFSHGVIEALELLVNLICDNEYNDKVLILTPSYTPFQTVCDKNNIKTVYSPLDNTNGYYTINFNDIKEKIRHNNIKLCIFCNPHNPTGRSWSTQELKTFMQIMIKNDVWIISD
jgi:cystathionine beta-lyase